MSDSPASAGVHRVFERVAGMHPRRIAVVSVGGSITYGELDARANSLARHLRGTGISPGDIVALALPRSIDMIVSMLAVLKAGAAYLPLDEANPEARNLLILEAARVTHVVCEAGSAGALLARRTAVHPASADARDTGGFSSFDATPDDKCYVMFTSGSTGDPKGVVVPHRAVVRLVVGTNYIEFQETDTTLHLSSPSFDASTFEIWGPLLNGARLALYSGPVLDPGRLRTDIATFSVTVLWLTAALFHIVVTRLLPALRPLRVLLAGGDVLNARHVGTVLDELPHLVLINGYGPTENTTFTCCHVITAANKPLGSVPIGTPVTGTEVHVLDDRQQPVAPGEVGELHASGSGIALGYLNGDPQGAFYRDGRIAAGLIYRTGDLVRRNEAGLIDFIGRKDSQVKIRGFRVSLEEIRLRTAELEGVSDVIVARKQLESGDQLLVAYVQPQDGFQLSAAYVKNRLSTTLPRYMIPDRIVVNPALPITSSGKLDRQAILASHVA